MKKIFVLLLICLYSEEEAEATNSFKFETSSLCPNNKKLPATILTLNSFNTKGKLCAFAEIDVKETFNGPILLEMTMQRCNEDLSQCVTYPPIKRENICNEFNTDFFGPELFNRIKPPLKCPIKPGRYIFNRTVADFSNLSNSNFITGKYKSTFNIMNGRRRQILCWNVITRVSGFSSRKN